jgi:hypothetical protein
MVVVMSDMIFPMVVKFGVLRVLYFIKSCPTSLRFVNIGKTRHVHITKPSGVMALTPVMYGVCTS